MNIEIRDATLEARIQKQLQATGSATIEEVLLRLLETQEEQDRWLLENVYPRPRTSDLGLQASFVEVPRSKVRGLTPGLYYHPKR